MFLAFSGAGRVNKTMFYLQENSYSNGEDRQYYVKRTALTFNEE